MELNGRMHILRVVTIKDCKISLREFVLVDPYYPCIMELVDLLN